MNDEKISLKQIVGGGYDEFWRSRKRYRVVKGSKASKKSTTTALNIIVRLMQYPKSNALVVRKTAATLKDSCYTQLKWAINRLNVGAWWRCTLNPLEIRYVPTGQKILFRGLDDPLKVASITVERGFLNFVWIEEAYEIDEDDFDKLEPSIRGIMPKNYFVQFTLTFNPWDASSWLKSRFFDTPKDNVFAATTNYLCNEWLSDDDRAMFADMKTTDPERYKVAGLGEWGVAAGQYFREWRSDKHIVTPFAIPADWSKFRSMDWGMARPYACYWWAVDYDGNLYAYRELYGWGGKPNVGTGETAKEVGEKIADAEKKDGQISYGVLDSACWARTGVTGPSVAEEINAALFAAKRVTFSKSSKGRTEGANALKQRFVGNRQKDGESKPAIYFFSTCIHAIRTIPQLAHDKHNPETYDTTGEDHAADAICYACLSRPFAPGKPQQNAKGDRWERHRERKNAASAWVS